MRIVICDDHHLLVQAMATALGDLGYTVEAAVSTPEDGIRAVALHDPDVLLVDVTFPTGSGLDAARAVLTVLRVRGIAVPDAVRERILAQKDPERLERWRREIMPAAVAATQLR